MLGKYLLDLNINFIFTGTYTYLLKPVRIHQSHCVRLKLSKPRSHIRNFPYLTKEINSISSSSKIQVLFLLLEEATLCFSNKLFYYLLIVSGTLAVTLDILCHMKNFKFLRNFELLHVVSEHKEIGLNLSSVE